MNCEFIGSDYGGFPCCISLLNENSIVLDFGVGEDISFALGVRDGAGCNVELFDFTPDSISWFKKNYPRLDKIIYNEYGVSVHDGILEVYDYGEGISRRPSWMGYKNNESHPVKSIKSIMKEKEINHIDLLKMDVEGEEYKIIPQIIKQGIFPTQLCIEEHLRFLNSPDLHNEMFSLILNHYDLAGRTQHEFCFIKKGHSK
tara:strand:- start:711 stop:1313 length:603 start_codon:yes stop_codon:yes gene_type:complete